MSERLCLACEEPLVQRTGEANYIFKKRKTCNRTCSGDFSKFTGSKRNKRGFVESYLERLKNESQS